MILSVCSVPLRMDSNSGCLLLLVEAMWSVRIIKNRPRVNQKVIGCFLLSAANIQTGKDQLLHIAQTIQQPN